MNHTLLLRFDNRTPSLDSNSFKSYMNVDYNSTIKLFVIIYVKLQIPVTLE